MSPVFRMDVQRISASNQTFQGTVRMTGGPNIVVGTDASGITISGSAESVQTQNLHNVTLSGNTAGAMAQISSGTMTLAGGNNITLSQAGNAVTISGAAAGGAQTAISGVAASNTTFTSGTITLTGVGGGITVSSNTGQRVDLSVAAPVAQTVQPGVQHFVVSNTTFSSGTVSISGFGDITVNTAANIIRISGSQSVQAETQTFIAAVGNSETDYTSGTVDLIGLANITIRSTTGQKLEFSVAAPGGGGGATLSNWIPYAGASFNVGQVGQANLYVMPLQIPQQLEIDRALHYANMSFSSSSNSSYAGVISLSVGIYTKNASTLSLATSGTVAYQFSNTSNNSFSLLTGGLRFLSVPLAATMTPGNYWVGVNSRTSTTNANWFTASNIVFTQFNSAWSGEFMQATNATGQHVLGFGTYSATTSGMPASMHFSQILQGGAALWRIQPMWNFAKGTV